jgi:hypothetical protein
MKELILLILAALAVALTPVVILQAKLAARSIAWNAVPEGTARMLAYNAMLAESARLSEVPEHDGRFVPDRVMGFNASLFDQGHFSEELTGYAVGFKDPENIEETLQFFAPSLPSPMKPEYATFASAEEFLSDGADDDLVGIGGDFPTVRYDSDKVVKKLQNRGLAMDITEEKWDATPNAEQVFVARLLRRLHRNSLRRAITLLSAAATNTAKTWSTAAGKDPDQDVKSELILAANTSGIRPNRVGYGDTAFDIRCASHRAQNSAGGYASAILTPEQLASALMVEKVKVSRERFTTKASATAAAEILNTKVLMFHASDGATEEDPSNIKRFTGRVAARHGGGAFAVHLRQVSDKGWRIAVEKYELIAITSTLGIRQFTVAAS